MAKPATKTAKTAASKPQSGTRAKRKTIPADIVRDVLTEAGYRCGTPTCRSILAIDLHHLVEVSQGGGNELANLIALCPTCHALHHRGTIQQSSLFAWKGVIVALGVAFDREAVDRLLFLSMCERDFVKVSGDGLLHYSRLIAASLVEMPEKIGHKYNGLTYTINISDKGRQLIEAWKTGDRAAVQTALS